MNPGNLALLESHARFHVREDRGDYDPGSRDADPDVPEHLYQAQALVGEAWNLAGLLLASMEDESDARAMQIHTAVAVIEEKLEKAYRQIGEHELRYAQLFVKGGET